MDPWRSLVVKRLPLSIRPENIPSNLEVVEYPRHLLLAPCIQKRELGGRENPVLVQSLKHIELSISNSQSLAHTGTCLTRDLSAKRISSEQSTGPPCSWSRGWLCAPCPASSVKFRLRPAPAGYRNYRVKN